MKVRKAVIPVAGMGTRFLPASKAIPKEMLTIVDKPTIQYIVEEVTAAGIEQVILITSEGKAAIENHFDYDYQLDTFLEQKGKDKLCEEVRYVSNLIDIVSVRQKKPLGLGHAIWSARHVVGDEPFLILLGDDLVISDKPCCAQMIELFNELQESIVAIQKVPKKETLNYGIIEGSSVRDRVYKVNRMVEKPAPGTTQSDLAIIGRYILLPDIFKYLEKTTPGHGGEIQLTDALMALANKRNMFAYEFEGTRYDAGDKLGYLKAIVALALRHPELGNDFAKHIKKVSKELSE
ncbi:MAG: UTP--glucose-1-phosphate uridylyltransferase GalU [Thermodesulfobacteriota bacterium]|nr:UTP--glucose-1-phosphate uridylyltransferase GalU [Thermodesulfobacteriota bacterium]